MAIAGRDPWPEVDAWLAGRIDRTEPLVLDRDGGPELGATAAAILLRRRRQTPSEFGLEPLTDPYFRNVNLLGYRFADEALRERVVRWWQSQAETKPE